MRLVYFSLVYSHLTYAITTWGSASASSLSTLKKINNRAMKNVAKINKSEHISLMDLCHSAHIFQLNEIYQYETLKYMYKIYNK